MFDSESFATLAKMGELLRSASDGVSTEILCDARNALSAFSEPPEFIKEAQARLKNGLAWAEFGWTTLDFEAQLPSPITQSQADETALSFYTPEEIEKIINACQKAVWNTAQMQESLQCFGQGLYRSSAFGFLSIFEGELIYFVQQNRGNGKGRIQPSRNNLRGFVEVSLEETEARKTDFYLYASAQTIMKFIDVIYVNSNGFDECSSLSNINRHYLMHGMYNKEVTKADCLKIMLAYCNILRLARNPNPHI